MITKPHSVDFETFYAADYSVKTTGHAAFCRDARFEAYLVSIHGDDIQFVGHPKDAPWEKLHGKLWLSHNAAFDEAVFLRLKELGIVPAGIAPGEWFCTADLSVYFGAPRNLEEAAHELLDMKLDKGVRDRMKGRDFADLPADEQEEVRRYAATDAEACYKIWKLLGGSWPEHERHLSGWTRTMGRHGIGFDAEKAAGYAALLRKKVEEIDRPFAEGGPLPWRPAEKPGSKKGLATACAAAGIPVPATTAKDSEVFVQWIEEFGDQAPWVFALKERAKANRILKVIEAMERRAIDGRLRFSLKYFGAAPGRWSGGGGLNLQNLNKETVLEVDLRSLLIPAPGCVFVIADLSQIEPRLLHWIAHDTQMLDLVKSGYGLYEAHARATMGWTGGKLKDEAKTLYALAKSRVLGLGYGAGADKFRGIAKTMGGLDLTLEESIETVAAYRQGNPKITGLWNRLERDMRGTPRGGTFSLPLAPPNCPDYQPRPLRYFNVHQTQIDDEYRPALIAATTRGGKEETWWGSKLTENLVQGLSRDVFASRCLALLAKGYRIVLHAHDEVAVETVKAEAESASEEIKSVLCTPPPWAEGLPLGAEVMIADCYKK